MERKAIVNISAAVVTAIISALILYQTLFAGNLLLEAGLIGMFFASMFSHLTIVGRDLFAPAFVNLTRYYPPLPLGFFAGVGAALGEVSTYYWGLGIREALKDNQKDTVISKWIEKYGLLAILLVASSPLPDTPIALLAGSVRFPFKKYLAVELIGKTVFYSIAAAVGGVILGRLTGLVDELIISAIVVAGSIALCIIASWSKSREKILELMRKILR